MSYEWCIFHDQTGFYERVKMIWKWNIEVLWWTFGGCWIDPPTGCHIERCRVAYKCQRYIHKWRSWCCSWTRAYAFQWCTLIFFLYRWLIIHWYASLRWRCWIKHFLAIHIGLPAYRGHSADPIWTEHFSVICTGLPAYIGYSAGPL
jgi:hypothetical protein